MAATGGVLGVCDSDCPKVTFLVEFAGYVETSSLFSVGR